MSFSRSSEYWGHQTRARGLAYRGIQTTKIPSQSGRLAVLQSLFPPWSQRASKCCPSCSGVVIRCHARTKVLPVINRHVSVFVISGPMCAFAGMTHRGV